MRADAASIGARRDTGTESMIFPGLGGAAYFALSIVKLRDFSVLIKRAGLPQFVGFSED